MKKIIYLFLAIIGSGSQTVSAQTPPTAPSGKKWVAVSELTDEFNATSFDFGKWMDYHPYWTGRNSVFTKANVSVTGTNLKLVLNKPGNTALAACVTSKNKSMKKGMYSEARTKCPSLSATGAFWFQGNYSEIDVIENFGQPTGAGMYNNRFNMKTNLHYFPNGWPNDQKTQYDYVGVNPAVDEAYHTYGVWWKDSRTFVWFLDGREVHTSIAKGDFNEDMYMFFDMEIFDWGIGFPTEASLDDPTKNAQYVDWVHTYKLVDNTLGIESNDYNDSRISIFPNPTMDIITINGLTTGDKISVANILGKTVLNSTAKEAQEVINTSALNSGIYIISIAGKESLKLVKQ
jgi:Secretion system C-terminal sorting domain/Glycosyl hydrolases family 16